MEAMEVNLEESNQSSEEKVIHVRSVERSLRLHIDGLPLDRAERKRALNNLASKKSKRAKKEYLANQEKELEDLIAENKRLQLEVAKLEKTKELFKSLFLKYGINEVWRPWSGDRSFITGKKYSIGLLS